jgi:hypothetical protein
MGLNAKPLTTFIACSGMYEFFVATIPRLGRYLLVLFLFSLGGFYSCFVTLLTTYLILFSAVWEEAHQGTKGVLQHGKPRRRQNCFLGLRIEWALKPTLSMG